MAKKNTLNVSTAEIIRLAGEAGAKAALETMENERKKAYRWRHDRRLRNIKLLMRNYRMLAAHCKSAIYDVRELIKSENVMDILDHLDECQDNEALYVESIKRSVERTLIIINHVDEMLRLYEIYCYQSTRPEDMRRFRIINNLYVADRALTVREIAEDERIDTRTVYKDIDAACEKLSALMFGIDGLKRE